MSKNSKIVSVFIPTYNGAKYIGECINAVLSQKLPANHALELLVIDSGSTDGTVDIIKAYGDRLKFVEIPNKEFSHGRTRDRAARMLSGEFVLFLTQDATPSSDKWLINMIEPFFVSEKVGCVFGRQVPRPFSVPTIKREVATVFGGLGAPDSVVIHRPVSLVDGHSTNSINTFFSDANSAARRDLLTGIIPFKDLPYAEDQALARDMQLAGYLKAYAPQGSVWHSNEYTAKEYYHRKFDEFIGLQESVSYAMTPSYRSLVLGWIRPTIDDIKFTIRDGEYNRRAKLKFSLGCMFYNIAEKRARYDAFKYFGNAQKREDLSLEARQKRK